ncbi:amino acid ABC transporter ATP-binding/permease protein [Anaerotignum sp.]|uniref:amino acid ABC transporter ATP-binding/permease protein n=1 Tax=Anaerotignum sp. TaxID=2039241 RepID=UPI002714F33B|nr:ABC transporter ATP-binding protein [Anaerotignum sp.]
MRRSGIKIMAGLIGLIKPLFHFMLMAIILGVLGFLCSISLTILGTSAVLKLLAFPAYFSLKAIFTMLILFAVLRGFLRYGEQRCNHYIAFKLLAIIRDKVFASLRRLCPAKLEGRDKGNLISIITEDIELLEVFYAHTISPIVIAIITSLIFVFFIGNFSFSLGLIAAVSYIFIGGIIPLFNGKKIKTYGMDYRNNIGKMNSVFLESLRGLGELIQFGQTKNRLDEINKLTENISAKEKKLKEAESLTKAITDFSILGFTAIMLLAAMTQFSWGVLSFEKALLATVTLMSSFGPVVALSNLSNNLAHTLASGERVLSLLEESPMVEEKTDGKNIPFHGVECKNLTFGYREEEILQNLFIDIPCGKIIGIHGKSGCGKSTLLKLLMRFWDKTSGSIKFSDTEIEEINTASLRSNESYCTQETYLFHDTIGNNIGLAKADSTEEEIIAAAKKASLHNFVETLPKGYQTPIGELGDTLSGGEKQRIGLARAFLSGAPFMLLDEPTSNLDSLNEGIILKSLNEAENVTILLVSHRKSTLGIASKVYSAERGRLS